MNDLDLKILIADDEEEVTLLNREMLKEVFSDAVSLLDEVENSDEALYKAKNQGKDQFQLYSTKPSNPLPDE